MDKTIAEKRQFPRIAVMFPIRITPEFLGETVDLSETGLRFILEKPLLLSKAQAKIELSPEESIDAEFKVIWNKQLVKENKFTYGVCFIRLKERDLEALRKVVILSQTKGLLDSIKEKNIRDKVYNFFMIHVKDYLDKINEINNRFIEKTIEPKAIEEKLSFLNDFVVQKGDELETEISNAIIIKKIKENFRRLVNSWTNRGLITKRSLEKPRGYPGDYELLEIIYNNKPISEGLGFYYDKDFLDNDYAIGVRERKNKMKDILRIFITLSDHNKINILNLACGSCREIRELFSNDKFFTSKELNFSCIDQDEEALKFAKNNLENLTKNIKFRFLRENVINFISKNNDKFFKILGKYHLIYSIGLADYLPDRVLKGIIRFCYELLYTGGKIVIAHKEIEKHKPLQPNWFCDWNFYSRDENKLINLVKDTGIKGSSVEKDYIEPGCIFFVTIIKK